MTEPLPDIAIWKQKAEEALISADSASAVEQWRVEWLGRKGKIPLLLRQLKELSLEERKQIGAAANALRQELEEAYKEKWTAFQKETGDDTSTSLPAAQGHLHPLTQTMRRIQEIFLELGFTLVEGPLVEDPAYNFDKLNIPAEHPARAETDTFYLTDGHLLRTSTSPVQLRSVEKHTLKPPFRVFSPGRVFRSEKLDATHGHTFHQVEGLVVEEGATIARFKTIIEKYYSTLFGAKLNTRLRPHYFPFVEPGFEVDISCFFCEQKGCRICKNTGWIEAMGAGMVHPVVLRNMNIDPEMHQGFAFGGGIDRLTMLQLGVTDLRDFWSGDVKFLSKF